MIAPGALTALEAAFRRSLQETGATHAAVTRVDMTRRTRPDPACDTRTLLVLTLASYGFRIVALFDFRPDTHAGKWFAAQSRANTECLSGPALRDAMSEYVNMVCGTANRLLSGKTLRTGMSTPVALSPECKAHLHKTAATETLIYGLRLDDQVELELVLCICAGSGTAFDLKLDTTAVEEVEGGELELF